MDVRALADTGALLAYIDRNDPWHDRCRDLTVFTIDHNDFETYRVGGRKRLRILPLRAGPPIPTIPPPGG